MNDSYAETITTFPIFHGFTANGTKRLIDEGSVTQHATGSRLFSEGDTGNGALLILSGTLEVFVEREGRDLVLMEVGPGSVLGELAVLCGIPRSASVRAKEDSVLLQWTAEAFRQILLRDPSLSQRIFSEALRTLIDKEKSLIETLIQRQVATVS
jgi:CRP-like cAMP-binding protein